jgi:hypothetical protein
MVVRKTWAHLDLESNDRRAEGDRLRQLGASVHEEFKGHTVMLDPEGNEFCVFDPTEHLPHGAISASIGATTIHTEDRDRTMSSPWPPLRTDRRVLRSCKTGGGLRIETGTARSTAAATVHGELWACYSPTARVAAAGVRDGFRCDACTRRSGAKIGVRPTAV